MKPSLRDVSAVDLSANRDRALALNPVSRETLARLDRFVEVLLTWQKTTNLIAASTIPELWTRHIADSLQLLAMAPEALIWADLGSGGGFPGLVIAIALAERPGAAVHLVESNGKKAAFLREAARDLSVPAIVHHQRIEEFAVTHTEAIDIVTARALAPLNDLIGLVHPLLERGAQALFLKGQDVDAELTEASKYWNIQFTLFPSRTDPSGRVLLIRQAKRRTPVR